MPNSWGRKPNLKIPPFAIGIIIIGIIGFILYPNLFSNTFSLANSTSALSDSNNINQSNTNNSNALNSANYPNQSLSNVNTSIGGNGNSEISTGYWVLYVNNNSLQQFSINAQDYTFLQGLINNDGKGTPSNQIFLVENGQIQKYVVSNEINTVISNLATIYKRSSINSQTPATQTPSTSNTLSPNNSSPGTTTPSTTSPNTTSPNTTSPNTTSPSTTSPSTTSPSTTSPNTTSPNTTSPNTTSPSTTSPNNSSSASNNSQNSTPDVSP